MEPMEPTQVVVAINAAFTLYEKVKGLLRDIAGNLPDGAKKAEATRDLAEADEALRLAKAKLAEGFGYRLCRRHMPPGIMLD